MRREERGEREGGGGGGGAVVEDTEDQETCQLINQGGRERGTVEDNH